MPRLGFKMQLFPGRKDEYKKRHDQIWPELKALLKESGIADYSIFLDEESNTLFGILRVEDEQKMEGLAKQEVMKKWWAYMKDIMASNPDGSPASLPLEEVFYMP